MQNMTITVPIGTQNHGNPKLLCAPARWTDVAIFFLANFVAHAATVKTTPGQPALQSLADLIFALLFPVFGIQRGLRAIQQCAVLAETPLEKAHRAGALCMVIRGPAWKPRDGDEVKTEGYVFSEVYKANMDKKSKTIPNHLRRARVIETDVWRWGRRDLDLDHPFSRFLLRFNRWRHRSEPEEPLEVPSWVVRRSFASPSDFVPATSELATTGFHVHGHCDLKPGYELSIVPPGMNVIAHPDSQPQGTTVPTQGVGKPSSVFSAITQRIRKRYTLSLAIFSSDNLSSIYNFPKALIAVFQSLYASFTLYQARGDQLQQYGYAAFGLTVAPYLVMSIVNLISTMLTPDYPAMYLVESEVMEEARRHGSTFKGTVGTVQDNPLPRGQETLCRFTATDRGLISVQNCDSSDTNGCLPSSVQVVKDEWKLGRPTSIERPSLLIPRCSEYDLIDYDKRGIANEMEIRGISIVVALLPLAINGALSRFDPGHSNLMQRIWTMTWLAFGIAQGFVGQWTASSNAVGALLKAMVLSAPCIGGMTVVGLMLKAYGHCVQLWS